MLKHVRQAAGWFFFSSTRRHTGSLRDWSSDVCSSDLGSSFSTEGTFTALSDLPFAQSIIRESTGTVRITWRGSPGSSYQLFASPDLSNWQPVVMRSEERV